MRKHLLLPLLCIAIMACNQIGDLGAPAPQDDSIYNTLDSTSNNNTQDNQINGGIFLSPGEVHVDVEKDGKKGKTKFYLNFDALIDVDIDDDFYTTQITTTKDGAKIFDIILINQTGSALSITFPSRATELSNPIHEDKINVDKVQFYIKSTIGNEFFPYEGNSTKNILHSFVYTNNQLTFNFSFEDPTNNLKGNIKGKVKIFELQEL